MKTNQAISSIRIAAEIMTKHTDRSIEQHLSSKEGVMNQYEQLTPEQAQLVVDILTLARKED